MKYLCAYLLNTQLFLLLALVSPSRLWALSFGRVVEPPPRIYADGPSLTGRTLEWRLSSVEQVDRACQALLRATGRGRGAYYMGCYAPRLDAVILMDPRAWPSRREWEEIRAHEWAHARGWRHPASGEGTDWLASIPPRRTYAAGAGEAARPGAAAVPDGRAAK